MTSKSNVGAISSFDYELQASSMYSSNLDICIAGALAAVIVDFTVYPFDTIKTRAQSPEYEKFYKDGSTGVLRRNVFFNGLYQGIWSVVLSTIPSSATFFTTYEAVKRTLNANPGAAASEPGRNRIPMPLKHAIASISGEMVSCLITTPAEVIKQNAQVVNGPESSGARNNKTRPGPAAQVLRRFRHQPWKLWSGYMPLVARNLPFTGLQFPIFEFVKARVLEVRNGQKSPNPAGSESRWKQVAERAGLTGLAASVSGTIASIATTPIDVVKTRIMLSAGDNATEEQGRQKPSSLAVGKQILREEGAKGLFRGGGIRVAWTAVSLSMYLSIYEGSRFYLENRRRDRAMEDGL